MSLRISPSGHHCQLGSVGLNIDPAVLKKLSKQVHWLCRLLNCLINYSTTKAARISGEKRKSTLLLSSLESSERKHSGFVKSTRVLRLAPRPVSSLSEDPTSLKTYEPLKDRKSSWWETDRKGGIISIAANAAVIVVYHEDKKFCSLSVDGLKLQRAPAPPTEGEEDGSCDAILIQGTCDKLVLTDHTKSVIKSRRRMFWH